MSGPNPPEQDSAGDELEDLSSVTEGPDDYTGGLTAATATEFPSQAYSAPESEQFTGPYVPADPQTYDYDSYSRDDDVDEAPPRWPWVVGITAIVAAVALVVSVSLLVSDPESDTLATSAPPTSSSITTTTSTFQDEITTTTPPPEPPPPSSEPPPPPPPTETVTETVEPPPPAPEPEPAPTEEPPPATSEAPPATTTTTPAGPRQVTYQVTGTKAPGDIVNVTYVDANGIQRTQRNVYIPWSITVTPISMSEVGSLQAHSVFLVSKLNCSIIASDGQLLAQNTGNSAQISC